MNMPNPFDKRTRPLVGFCLSIVLGISPGVCGAEEVTVASPKNVGDTVVLSIPARTAPAEEARIFSRATGVVSRRFVDIGDLVKEGDVLAEIDAPEINRSVERARALLALAQARFDLAKSGLQRARTMASTRVIAAEALDEREAAGRTAAADVMAAQAELNRFEEIQRFQQIRAPFNGVISGRRIDRGDHIDGDQVSEDGWLFHVVRIDELRVQLAAVPSAALRLKPGQPAAVTFQEIPGREFEAVVSRANQFIDASGTMQVELTLPNADLTVPAGLTGTAKIKVASAAKTVEVPANAIVVRDGKSQVARVESGVIRFVPVTLGKNKGPIVEVSGGLTESDSVVTNPNSLLREGDAVTVKVAAKAKTS